MWRQRHGGESEGESQRVRDRGRDARDAPRDGSRATREWRHRPRLQPPSPPATVHVPFAAAVCGAWSRVRSHRRFRDRGTEYVSDSGMKWMSRGAK